MEGLKLHINKTKICNNSLFDKWWWFLSSIWLVWILIGIRRIFQSFQLFNRAFIWRRGIGWYLTLNVYKVLISNFNDYFGWNLKFCFSHQTSQFLEMLTFAQDKSKTSSLESVWISIPDTQGKPYEGASQVVGHNLGIWKYFTIYGL